VLAGGVATFVPTGGEVFYAQWIPNAPIASNDVYNCTYNQPCTQPAGTIFGNDWSTDTSTITVVKNGAPSLSGASPLVVASNGSFTYVPQP
jgi:hypothetical protein